MFLRTCGGLAFLVTLGVASAAAAQAPPPPVSTATPKPTPKPTPTPTPAAPPQAAAPAPAAGALVAKLGVPIYPGAALLQTLDVGSGQQVFVFGTNDPYASVVSYYKSQLGKSTEVSRNTPSIQQFDLGPFDSNKMSHRPSLLVKDFIWPDPAGYIHVDGATIARYKTLIQIIPAAK